MTSEVYSKRKKMNTSAENKALNFQNKDKKSYALRKALGKSGRPGFLSRPCHPRQGTFPLDGGSPNLKRKAWDQVLSQLLPWSHY